MQQSKQPKSGETVTAIILAGGKGTRMKSPLPKVLHPVGGEPMISRILHSLSRLGITEKRVVVGFGQNLVRQVVEPLGVNVFVQTNQLGTADAVRAAQPESLEGNVLILNGDHPLVDSDSLGDILQNFLEQQLDLGVVSCELKSPKDFGRIIRRQGRLVTIVEAKDAGSETLKIREINTGIYIVKAKILNDYLPKIDNQNAKQEYYLTDLISLAILGGAKVDAILTPKKSLAFGVNSLRELAKANSFIYRQKCLNLMDKGVMILDPHSTYIEDSVEIAAGTVIYPNVFVRGRTRIASFCVLEPNVIIQDSEIGESVQIRAGSLIEKSKVHARASLGPYARLRPETEVGEEAHIGNFVELKKAHIGKGSKAAHLTYLGDALIGEDVNIGCGTITCNYAVDRKKYQTVIGNRVFVGSDSQFIAPVSIGDDAIIASGSTITKDVPPKALGVARAKQENKGNFADRLARRSEKAK